MRDSIRDPIQNDVGNMSNSTVGGKEFVYVRGSVGPCAAHEWPDDGLPERLIKAMRERHGHGGVDVCVECLERAKRAQAGFRERR